MYWCPRIPLLLHSTPSTTHDDRTPSAKELTGKEWFLSLDVYHLLQIKNGLAKELSLIKWTECYPCPLTLAQTFAYSLSQSLAWQKNTEMCTYTYYIYSCFLASAIIKRRGLSFYKINRLAVPAHSHVRERHWLEWSVSNPMKKKISCKHNNWNWIQWLIWSQTRAEQSAPNPVPSPWSSQPIGFVLDEKECDLYLSEPRNFAGPSRAKER